MYPNLIEALSADCYALFIVSRLTVSPLRSSALSVVSPPVLHQSKADVEEITLQVALSLTGEANQTVPLPICAGHLVLIAPRLVGGTSDAHG